MLVYQPSQPVQNSVPVKTFSQWYENILYSPDPHLRGLIRWRLSQIYQVSLFKLQCPLWVSLVSCPDPTLPLIRFRVQIEEQKQRMGEA